jgi:hypothetical protein
VHSVVHVVIQLLFIVYIRITLSPRVLLGTLILRRGNFSTDRNLAKSKQQQLTYFTTFEEKNHQYICSFLVGLKNTKWAGGWGLCSHHFISECTSYLEFGSFSFFFSIFLFFFFFLTSSQNETFQSTTDILIYLPPAL